MPRYTFKITGEKANADEVDDLADILQRWTGIPVIAVETFEITTTSEAAAKAIAALTNTKPAIEATGSAPARVVGRRRKTDQDEVEPETLEETLGEHGAIWQAADDSFKDADPRKRKTRGMEMPNRAHPRSQAPAPTWGNIKAWEVRRFGKVMEKITRPELDRRLLAGEFPPGTIVRHPQSGSWAVTGRAGYSQSLARRKAPEAPKTAAP